MAILGVRADFSHQLLLGSNSLIYESFAQALAASAAQFLLVRVPTALCVALPGFEPSQRL